MIAMRWLLLGLVALGAVQAACADELDAIRLPAGFRIDYFARDVGNARQMALGDKGTLFVGSRDAGKVYAISHDGVRANRVRVIVSGLQMPSGIAFRAGSLYVGAISRILRYDAIEDHLEHPPAPMIVRDDFPEDVGHGWKFIAFGPDGWLYVPVGAPCNVCEADERHGAIFRLSPDGKTLQTVARGVRNSVGFDWDPGDKSLWFNDNGRDMLGDDVPPDELNHVVRAGQDFGFPYCHGGDIADPEFGAERDCSKFVAPALRYAAHIAPLGMRFYTGTMFPAEYRGDIFTAQHGSWNRSKKAGYQIVRVHVENGRAVKSEAFASGWLQGEKVTGRPADVLVMPDGALLVADDYADAIYRISYRGPVAR